MKNLIYIGNQLKDRGGTPTSIDILAPLLRIEGFKITTASSKKNQLLRLSDMLLTIIGHYKGADAVLIDTYSTRNFWYAVYCAKLCRLLSLRYILLLHGGQLHRRIKSHAQTTKALFFNAHLNICPSAYMQEILLEEGINNARFIPNPVRRSDYTFKIRSEPKPHLLWVRSFAKIYNPILAIKVLEELLVDYPEAKLCMVGPKKDESFEECVAYALEKELPVEFPGLLSKDQWGKLSKDYDIFLNTTEIDNTPVSLIEAMALGLPIVSTQVGGISYLINDMKTGLLVPPGDATAMLSQVKMLLQRPKLAEKISLAARKKIEVFDWEIVKKEWKALLEDL
ncbi:glycosyltransferase family 4 protein [Salegentibacter sp. F14]